MTRMLKRILFFCLLLFIPSVFADSQLNLTPGVTPISHDIYDLHMTIFWICVAIACFVFGIIIYSLIKHRKSQGHKVVPFRESTKLEIIWTVVPFIILFVMAIPATKVLIDMNDVAKADINIKVTGYQWKWKYDYLDQDITFFSNLSTPHAQLDGKAKKGKWYLLEVDKPMVVPIHKKVRLLVTSNDVIHSWWVPALGVKRDAIPGFIHEAWFRVEKPGTYRGQCAELCGMNHAYMPIVVVAKTQAGFEKWVRQEKGLETDSDTSTVDGTTVVKKTKAKKQKPLTKAEIMALGKSVYMKTCAVCHKPNGTGMPPAFPSLVKSKVCVGSVKAHILLVLNGKKGTAMQPFKEQLTDQQIAAVVTYERNAWGNDKLAGQVVRAKDVKKLR